MSEIYLRSAANGTGNGTEPVDENNPFPVNVLNLGSPAPVVNVLKNAQMTVSTTAIELSSVSGGIPASAIGVQCFVETAGIRLTEDGATAPTTTAGTPMTAGTSFYLWTRKNMQNCRVIRSGGADATLTMEFLGVGDFT